MHLMDNGAIEIEVETSEEAAQAALAAAREVFENAGVTPAAAYQAWTEGSPPPPAGEDAPVTLWDEAQQAAARASGGEARIALAGTSMAFADAMAEKAHEADNAPYRIELPAGGFEPEGSEFP